MIPDPSISAFYPPRARWYSRFLYPWLRLVYHLRLNQVPRPGDIPWPLVAISLVVPGFSFWAAGRRSAGGFLLTAYIIAALLFLPALGHALATFCAAVLLGSHCVSVFYLELLWLGDARVRFKMFCAFATLAGMFCFAYLPAYHLLENRWVMPLRLGNKVVLIQRIQPALLHRGGWAAYRMLAYQGRGVYIRGGIQLGPVLAVPGDRVEFSNNAVRVNGVTGRRLDYMPDDGGLDVAENHWLIWPVFVITQAHGQAAQRMLSDNFLRLAMVETNQLIGRPYAHWFWLKQTLEVP